VEVLILPKINRGALSTDVRCETLAGFFRTLTVLSFFSFACWIVESSSSLPFYLQSAVEMTSLTGRTARFVGGRHLEGSRLTIMKIFHYFKISMAYSEYQLDISPGLRKDKMKLGLFFVKTNIV
jgi:hypothetical protein